jgi:thiamine phosphate synthase YjbQ (UPF0047 family)
MSYALNSFLNEPFHKVIDDYMATTQISPSSGGVTDKTVIHPVNPTLKVPLPSLRDERLVPSFLQLDRKKIGYVDGLFERGSKMIVEGEKPEITPKHVFEASLAACRSEEERARTIRVNERLLDQRIVVNIGPDLDQTIKNYATHPDGVAILKGPGFAFMEHEHGSARDLKKAVKRTLELVKESGTNGHGPMSTMLTPVLPLPFQGFKLNYGTWGRPAFIDENIDTTKFQLNLSIVKVNSIERFIINEKPKSGFYTSDITDRVQEKVTKSGLQEGFALVTSFHTTVGIIKMNPADVPQLHKDLLKVAPEDPSFYYHNKVETKGVLKLRSDGKHLGDGNGMSHVHASLIGFYTMVPVKDGKLVLDGERILHHDCDTLPPRERGIAVTTIEKKEAEKFS